MSRASIDEAATWLAAEHELIDRIVDALHQRFQIDRTAALEVILDAVERLQRGLA